MENTNNSIRYNGATHYNDDYINIDIIRFFDEKERLVMTNCENDSRVLVENGMVSAPYDMITTYKEMLPKWLEDEWKAELIEGFETWMNENGYVDED